MPLLHISMRAGKPDAYRQAILDGLYLAMREALNVPDGDEFMTISELSPANFRCGNAYGGAMPCPTDQFSAGGRKATGTAHSCEVIVKVQSLRWLRGEASVARFDLPNAKSFATAFCKTCGSPMPHLTRSGREAIIHAGAFDQPLDAAPDRHVHWASRAKWYVHGDELPVED
jgi:hypothetical protein